MEKIKITAKEYSKLLRIAYCAETFLQTNNRLTKERLTGYINEYNNQ